jgi:hypothetical protein
LSGRLVMCLFGAFACAVVAAAWAVIVGWGLLAALALYSGVGSVALVVLSVIMPQRAPRLARPRRRPAFA